MDPITLATIFQGVVGGGQLLGGAIGSLMNKRPEKEIPDSLRQSTALAKAAFLDPKMSGYEQAAESIDVTAANQLQAAAQGGRVAESLAGVAGSQQAAYQQLESQNQIAQERDRDRLTGELDKMAAAEDLVWQMNEFAPFRDKYQQSRDVFGAGIENTFGALDKAGLYSMLNPGSTQPTPGSLPVEYGSAYQSSPQPSPVYDDQYFSGSGNAQAAPDEIISLLKMLNQGAGAAKTGAIPWQMLAKIFQ